MITLVYIAFHIVCVGSPKACYIRLLLNYLGIPKVRIKYFSSGAAGQAAILSGNDTHWVSTPDWALGIPSHRYRVLHEDRSLSRTFTILLSSRFFHNKVISHLNK